MAEIFDRILFRTYQKQCQVDLLHSDRWKSLFS